MEAQEIIGALRARGMSQRVIAERTGLSQGAISHIETGRRKNVMSSTKDQLSALYDEAKDLPVKPTPATPSTEVAA